MPNLLEVILHPLSLVFFAMYGGLMLWESIAPARPLPRVQGWRWRGLASFAVYFLGASYLPLLWDAKLAEYQLVDLSMLGTVGGFVVGLVVYEIVGYAWHRALHGSNVLWRGFHQLHHSAERLDTFSAFWFAPLDVVGWTAASSFALTLVVGLSPTATTLTLMTLSFLAMFGHTNVRTPRWLGYLVARPENHSYHHLRGSHAHNFADLPVFDMLFGTFENPHDFAPETGFKPGASARVWDMLCMRDVSGEDD
ncbi:MAG TPA: sterol desaturase family protein, partial [Steroidobacteraceae bacterium]|nr:sterol desaturase family protein [Steroidobacteraceae bacterium]